MYLKKIREQGGVVSASIVVAASKGILLSIHQSQLVEFGGHINLSKEWAYKLLHRMNFVKRKATTAKSKYTPEDFARQKQAFLDEVVGVMEMEELPPELILNGDQTGINLVPASSWTMDQSGAKRVEIKGVNDKQQITAQFCGTLTGDFFACAIDIQGQVYTLPPSPSISKWVAYHSLATTLVHRGNNDPVYQ